MLNLKQITVTLLFTHVPNVSQLDLSNPFDLKIYLTKN